MMKFKDRTDAGRQLAAALSAFKHAPNTVVIGLPRGGVPVAFEVARALSLPLDVIVTRKIGAPLQQELAVGAVTQDGTVLFNDDIMRSLGLSSDQLQATVNAERQEAQRRIDRFRHNKPPLDLLGKTVILVDDGVATGATMRAAIQSARAQGAKRIVLALPVAPQKFKATILSLVDEVIILNEADYFPAVGYFYRQFAQTHDDEVVRLLQIVSQYKD